jgi:hypothetical protein
VAVAPLGFLKSLLTVAVRHDKAGPAEVGQDGDVGTRVSAEQLLGLPAGQSPSPFLEVGHGARDGFPILCGSRDHGQAEIIEAKSLIDRRPGSLEIESGCKILRHSGLLVPSSASRQRRER